MTDQMDHSELLRKARDAFRTESAELPALTLRGANAVDGYDRPEPYDAEVDASSDEYLERFSFWAMPYLDARSWRHYLPRFIEYALAHPDDPAMVVEAVVRSLRPPDRVPTRLTTLSSDQEAVVTSFLELLALGDDADGPGGEARTALEEWWLPGTYLRPQSASAPRGPTTYREVGGGAYRVTLPTTLEGGGVYRVPEEHRSMEMWRGIVCGDALADVIMNSYPLAHRGWGDVEETTSRWLAPESRRRLEVPGAKRALRLDGTTYRYSPAEPEHTTVVIAQSKEEVLTLTVRGTERVDVQAELDRVIRSFRIGAPHEGG